MSRYDLRDEVYPAIYSGYPKLLNYLYSRWMLRSNAQKQAYLQNLQEPARELWRGYQRQDISPDYSRPDYQEVYLLRYFFPHSLLVPTVLDFLFETEDFFEDSVFLMTDLHYLENTLLTASFLGSGPCPELYGLMHYMNNSGFDITRVSAAMLDSVFSSEYTDLSGLYSDLNGLLNTEYAGWEYSRVIVFESLLDQMRNPSLYKFCDFESDLTATENDFLHPISEQWVKDSDLVVIQFCLNEIDVSKHDRLIENIMNIVDIMKRDALMLVIERQRYVETLLGELHDKAEKVKEVRSHHSPHDSIRINSLNYSGHVPAELTEHLFLKKFDSGLWLANEIKFHWLAILKQ